MINKDKTKEQLIEEIAILHQRNRELEASEITHKEAEEALQKQSYALSERVKELTCLFTCLFTIFKFMEKKGILLGELFQSVVDLIPPAWQYPEITCAQIVLEDQVFRTNNFKETSWKQSSNIMVHGDQVGRLDVFYLEEKPEKAEGPFLKEERNVINVIGERLSEFIEHKRAEEKIKDLAKFPSENPSPVLRVGKDGKVLYANEAALQLLLGNICLITVAICSGHLLTTSKRPQSRKLNSRTSFFLL